MFMPSRRRFLQTAGVGLTAGLSVESGGAVLLELAGDSPGGRRRPPKPAAGFGSSTPAAACRSA